MEVAAAVEVEVAREEMEDAAAVVRWFGSSEGDACLGEREAFWPHGR